MLNVLTEHVTCSQPIGAKDTCCYFFRYDYVIRFQQSLFGVSYNKFELEQTKKRIIDNKYFFRLHCFLTNLQTARQPAHTNATGLLYLGKISLECRSQRARCDREIIQRTSLI